MGSYKVAAPSHYLIITGFNIPDIKVEKKAFVWPGQSCRDLDISPVDYPFDLQAVSVEGLPFTLQFVLSIGPRDEKNSLKRFAKRSLSPVQAKSLIKGITEREAQQLAADLPMEQVLGGTGEFSKTLSDKVQLGLDQYELHVYNANITQLVDKEGKKIQKETAPANQEKVAVGQAEEIRTALEANVSLHHQRPKADASHDSEQYKDDRSALANSQQKEVEGTRSSGELSAEEAYRKLPQAEDMALIEFKPHMDALGLCIWDKLPVRVMALILSKTTPRDACRLALVNKRFLEAASRNQVWNAFLPRLLPAPVEETSQAVQDGAPLTQRAKDLYNRLTNHVLLGHGTAGYFIDRGTGGVCRTFSARTLGISWGDDHRYWNWIPSEGSRFPEVAFLKNVCWLHVQGTIDCRVPPGTYTLSWVLKFDSLNRHGWDSPITFFSTDGRQVYENIVPQQSYSGAVSVSVSRLGTRTIADEWLGRKDRSHNGWWEYNVGKFTVRKAHDAENLGDLHLKFEIKETTHLRWKGGLYIDGVIVRST